MASVRKHKDGKYQVVWREPRRDEYGVPTGQFKQTSETIVRDRDQDAEEAA
jgi:integrase